MYAPLKPSFDGAIPFLWMMAVGTVACASVWTVVVVGEEVRTYTYTTRAQKRTESGRAESLRAGVKMCMLATAAFVVVAYQAGRRLPGWGGEPRRRGRGAASQYGARVHRHVLARPSLPLLLQLQLVRLAPGLPLLPRESPGDAYPRIRMLLQLNDAHYISDFSSAWTQGMEFVVSSLVVRCVHLRTA